MLRIINIILLILFIVIPANAARLPVSVGTPVEKADIHANFRNTDSNFAEIYRRRIDSVSEYGSFKSAIGSTGKTIVIAPGTYITDGGATSAVDDRVIYAVGATIVLKNSATSFGLLNVTGARTRVIGGTWDGNRENNTSPDSYWYYGIRLAADGASCIDTTIKNSAIGIRFDNSDDILLLRNSIGNTSLYGIYGSSTTKTTYRNVLDGNVVDMSGSVGTGKEGILLTSSPEYSTENWQLINNDVTGLQGETVPVEAINMAVRGNNGLVLGNTTRYGSMGFSEGGNYTRVTNNSFLDLQGTMRYGVEFSGSGVMISNNIITGALHGVITSGNVRDQAAMANNNIVCASGGTGYSLQPTIEGMAQNVSITGGTVKCQRGVSTKRDIAGLNIKGVTFIGPGSSDTSSVGIFFDTPPLISNILISGSIFNGFSRAFAVYDTVENTYSGLYSAANVFIDVANAGWSTDTGAAIIGNSSVINFD